MIKFIKRAYYKFKLKRLYKKVQKQTAKKFKLRMRTIRLGEDFIKVVKKLEALGVKNPKALVLGERPETGKVK